MSVPARIARREQAFDEQAFARDALAALTARPKQLPPKYFYDETGSALFERITELPEYYPTRCELAILNRHAAEPSVTASSGPPGGSRGERRSSPCRRSSSTSVAGRPSARTR